MAQPGINAKIEELQFRLKTDPKSRLFFPLAEELRKHGKLAEAEQVLRAGLTSHATYLSAWVSLGRVLREQRKNTEAVEALTMAMQVDPGNVVAARLLADTYFELGEKVEAIKKYKLVHALMPSDEELEAKIASLDREIQAPVSAPLPSAPEAVDSSPVQHADGRQPESAQEPLPSFAEAQSVFAPEPVSETLFASEPLIEHGPAIQTDHHEESASSEPSSSEPSRHTVETPFDTGDDEPMAAHHAQSPFEDPSPYSAASLEIEQPEGMHVEEARSSAADPWADSQPHSQMDSQPEETYAEPAADVFAPAEPEAELQPEATDDVTVTTTMADLYVRQGLVDDARKIYEHMLQRDPGDGEVRAKLDALTTQVQALPDLSGEQSPEEELELIAGNPKVRVLQQWMGKIARREEGRG